MTTLCKPYPLFLTLTQVPSTYVHQANHLKHSVPILKYIASECPQDMTMKDLEVKAAAT